MKLKDLFLNRLFSTIFRYVFSFLLGSVLFLIIYFTSDRSLVSACNTCFIPGVVLLGIGFFSLLNLFGAFDFMEYGFVSIAQSLRKGSIREYEDLIDYKEKKKAKRKHTTLNFLPYVIFALCFLIASFVIRAVI